MRSTKETGPGATADGKGGRPDLTAKLAEAQFRFTSVFGQCAFLMMSLPRYRQLPLRELDEFLVAPMRKDRVSVAYADSAARTPVFLGAAIWATVSSQVDKSIREQIAAGVLPLRLGPEDWTSGEILWLIDLVTPNKQASDQVILGFGEIAGNRQVNIHPLVEELITEGTLQTLRGGQARTPPRGAPDAASPAAS